MSNKKNINVVRSSMPSFQEYVDEIKVLWETRWLTNSGEKHKLFQQSLETFLGSKNVVLFVNGHSALEAAIASCDFPEKSEVITTPFTFISTTNSIVRNNLVPVFCDIDCDTFTIDPSKIESLITDKTVAILAVHVYGNICNVEELAKIAKKHNLKIIYDAAHAFGVRYKGFPISNYGDLSMFSFHATKVFHSIEGGCITTNDDHLAKRMNIYKNFGLSDTSDGGDLIGPNFKMNEFQASMGICNLRHIHEYIKSRKNAYDLYCSLLKTKNTIKLMSLQPNVESNYSYFPVVFENNCVRDKVFEELKKNNIGARKYFYPCTNEFNSMRLFNKQPTPIAKDLSERVLALPFYSELSSDDISLVCKIVLENC